MSKLLAMLIVRIGVALLLTLIVGLIGAIVLGFLGLGEAVKPICFITFIIGLFINPDSFLSNF